MSTSALDAGGVGPDDGWGDDGDVGLGGLDVARGGSEMGGAAGQSSYMGGGFSLGDDDDPFAEDAPAGGLELDLPSSHASANRLPVASAPVESAPSPSPSRSALPAVRPSDPELPSHPSVPRMAAVAAPTEGNGSANAAPAAPAPPETPPAPPDPAALIARYPAPPSKVWEAPAYAMRVVVRQLELRQDLASLRKRRSPDVALYERALTVHDHKTFALGTAIACAVFALASFVFFLPVILRILRDPD